LAQRKNYFKRKHFIQPEILLLLLEILIAFGNNIFLDNINIAKPDPGDLQLVSIDKPDAIICTPAVTPVVTIKNTGSETIASFNVSYIVDNNPAFLTSFTSVNLAPGQQISVTLDPPFTVTTGAYNIKSFYIKCFNYRKFP